MNLLAAIVAIFLAIIAYGVFRTHGIEAPYALCYMIACGIGYYRMIVDVLRAVGVRL